MYIIFFKNAVCFPGSINDIKFHLLTSRAYLKLYKVIVLTIFSFLYNTTAGQSVQKETINQVRKNILTQHNESVDKVQLGIQAGKWVKNLEANGSWPDLNYESRSAGDGKHLERIREMAALYMLQGDGADPKLHQQIENAVTFWLSLNPPPKSENWWFGTIKIPLDAGYVLLFMQEAPKRLSDESVKGLLNWMKKSRSIESQASTDLVRILGIGMHYLLRGCVTYDETLITESVRYVSQMLEPDSGYTGIQADYSFHDHGDQLYSQGYGVVMLERYALMSELLSGTPYAFSGRNVEELFKFAQKSLFKLARGQYLDFNVAGRGIARKNNIHANRLVPLLTTYMKLDAPEQMQYYDATITRFSGDKPAGYKIFPEHIQLWSSDYTAHIRPGYFVGLRMICNRIVKPEKGNGESLLEHFRGNGAMSIMVNGNEYDNIFPVWKWNQVPGTTVPALQDITGQKDWFFNYGKTNFVGGLSDGKYGAAVYVMDDYNTRANKAWFFFDKQIVCLGAGITSSNKAPVFTTINQSLSNSGVVIRNETGVKEYTNDSLWANVKAIAVVNDKVGYSFPGSENLQLSNGIQKGSWFRINANLSKDTVEKRVFTLHIDHGISPNMSAYNYTIWPGINSINDINDDATSVLSNTQKIQAVFDKSTDILQAVFYEDATLRLGKTTLKVSEPCLIMIKQLNATSPSITVADPTQKLKRVKINLDRGKQKGKNEWICDLPQGVMAGMSMEVNLFQ